MSENIFNKLQNEHEKILDMIHVLAGEERNEGILEKIGLGGSDRDWEGKDWETTFNNFKTELKAHMRAEEHSLYDTMKQHTEIRVLALVGEVEHRLASEILEMMDRSAFVMAPTSDDWKVQSTVLMNMLEKHIKEEEDKILPKAKDILDDNTVERISREFERIHIQME